MIHFLMIVAGLLAAFYSIGVIVTKFDTPLSRAIQLFIVVASDLLTVVLATFFMPTIVPYLFTFAFTRGMIYSIANVEYILYKKY